MSSRLDRVPRLLARAGILVVLGAMSACQSIAQPRIVAARDVEKVLLFTSPAPLNLDQTPGVDGIRVKIYVFRRTEPKPVAIGNGAIEILMYEEGETDSIEESDREPFQTWSFSSDDLALRATLSMVGIGYPLVLRWDDRQPPGRVRVLARVRDDDGDVVYSKPVSLSMGMRSSELGARD